MAQFTKAERASIDTAYRAISAICERTNWSDAPALREALKLERSETKDATAAKAMVAKAWLEGATNPDKPARDLYWIRAGYLKALMLGVRHQVERGDCEYTASYVADAKAACPAAIAANDAHTRRIVGDVMAGER
ncbi:hypothetical protein [Sphingomonas sp.]|uniref:hypothetical protein n=1 Tax=Sphingomonas sp. TaxID=28214 RepID=UPI0035A8FDFD